MRSDRLPDITFRLRHVKAVYGRNFRIPKMNSDALTGVFFAVSPINTSNSGYCYVSETSANLKNPEWEHIEQLRTLTKLRSCKGVLFSFFLQQKQGNILLFEVELYFSGLVLLDSEMRENPFLKTADNQIFIQLGSHIYAPRDYLKINEGLPVSPISRSPQFSYGYNCIQRFLINMESSRVHVQRMRALRHSIDVMKDSLRIDLDQKEKHEELSGRMILLRDRLSTSNFLVSTALQNSEILTQRLFDVDDKLKTVYRESNELTDRLDSRLQSIKLIRSKLSQVQKLLTSRATEMLAELDDIFSPDLIWPFSSQLQESTVAESVNNRTTAASNYRQQGLHTGYSFDSLFSSWNFSNQTDLNDLPPTDSTNLPSEISLKSSVEPDLTRTSTALGYAAYLLTLLAVILDQPIFYPLDFMDGFSRTKIMDLMTPCLPDMDRILPLYPTKAAAIPSYKNAIRLLLWNVISLRARFGLLTPSERSIAWNLKSLVDHFCLKDPVLD